MIVLRKVKIRYFRSVYTATLDKCGSLNVISGCNDAGKSNVLKALNLFFNGDTDWNTPFDFYTDFSAQRGEQVRKETVKGKQFISIGIDFERPPNYKHSLPPTFTVIRTWLRDSARYTESHNLEHIANKKGLPSTLETAKRFLSQFLNRIHFEYVPAVKDRAYFAHLLSTLQTRLLDSPLDESAAPLVGDLASHIQGQIGQLQDDFKRATTLETFIEPPQELSSLFQSFFVSTKSKGNSIPLRVRGDGIQARYVPSVLHYISSRSHDFFIWGFEEPENSLEYSHVTSLARDFEQTYSKSAQIFIASHSPALVSLHDTNTACYRAFKKEGDITVVAKVWPVKGVSGHRDLLMNDLGILEIQKEVHEQYAGKLLELQKLTDQVGKLQKDLTELGKPILLVEGKHDRTIIESVWTKLFGDVEIPFIVRVADPTANDPAGGSGGASSVGKMVEALHPDEERKAVGLFDRDDEGIKCFERLSKNFQHEPTNNDIKRHQNGLAFAMLLPAPDHRADHVAAKNLTLEFMFSDEVIHRKTPEGQGLVFSHPKAYMLVGKQRVDVNEQTARELLPALPGFETIRSGKDTFAEFIVPECTTAECESFRLLFNTLLGIIGQGD